MINARELLTPDYRKLNNEIKEIIAHQLHYFDCMDSFDRATVTAKDIQDVQDGAITRLRTDYIFNAKVQSIVACLVQAIHAEHDERVSKFSGDSGLLKIVEA